MFKITRDTDPKTVMIEGRPSVEIVAFGPRNPFNITVRDPGTMYVYAKRAEGIFSWDGGYQHAKEWGYDLDPKKLDAPNPYRSTVINEDGYCEWGRIVPRLVITLDPALPIEAVNSLGTPIPYRLLGIFTPADGSEPILRVTPEDYRKNQTGYELDILASTGKVTNKGGHGSALTFRNVHVPAIKAFTRPVYVNGRGYPLIITTTDGEVTDIVWNKDQ